MELNNKAKEYLESQGFHYYEYDDTWVAGYFGIDDIIIQLNFYSQHGYEVIINDYDIYEEEDLEIIRDKLAIAREAYYNVIDLIEGENKA